MSIEHTLNRTPVNIEPLKGSEINPAYTYPDLQSGLFIFDPRLRIRLGEKKCVVNYKKFDKSQNGVFSY